MFYSRCEARNDVWQLLQGKDSNAVNWSIIYYHLYMAYRTFCTIKQYWAYGKQRYVKQWGLWMDSVFCLTKNFFLPDKIIFYLIREILEDFQNRDNAIKKIKKFGFLRKMKLKTHWVVAAPWLLSRSWELKNVWWRKRNYQPSA